MTDLMKLVKACGAAESLPVRTRFIEDVLSHVGPALLAFIRRHTRADLVDDAYQDTLVAVALQLCRCRIKAEPKFWGWCYQTARHKMADQWRKSKSGLTVSLEHAEIQQALEALAQQERFSREDWDELNYALELLRLVKPPCVDYLWDAIALNLSYEVMAQIYGLTENAARMRVNRCLELAQELVAKKVKVANG